MYTSYQPEASPRRHHGSPIKLIFVSLLVAILVFCALCFFFEFLPNTLKTPGVATYDSSLTPAETEFLKSYLEAEDVSLASDVNISAAYETTPIYTDTALIYDIFIPVTNFYDSSSTISATAVAGLLNNLSASTNSATTEVETPKLISVNDLSAKQKLLAIDGNYYLDSFNSGAYFRTFYFTGDDPSEAMSLISTHLPAFPTAENTLSLAQTGVTALSRGMQKKLAAVGDSAYFAANIKDFLSTKDLTHISNEVSFVEGCNIGLEATSLCADPLMIDAITAIGTDIVELTGNHNQDFGDEPALATLATYQSLELKTFGGGATAAAAAQPLEINQDSAKITLLGYNFSTSGYTTDDTPGANFYTEEKAIADITAAKQAGNFIIVDIQYYECYSYPDEGEEMPSCDAPISGQTEFFRHLIDLGADIVVGTQAHQPQTYELYNGGAIYYGLGNLFFDQTYWPGTTRGLILTHYFINGNHIQTRISPTAYGDTYQPTLLDEQTSTWLLNRLVEAKP